MRMIAPAAGAPPRMLQGGVGLIDMPSARFASDGELSTTVNFFENTQHYSLGFQALPWLEANFRYSGIAHFDPLYPIYYDRSFAMKARLWQEGSYMPAVAIGINDLVGTGVYSGEYLVLSKSAGALDFTLGVGWGRLGSSATFRNPFTLISKSFETRPGLTTPGDANFGSFFRGPTTGVFGGVVWNTPVKNLSLVVEYSSDRYTLERARGAFIAKSEVNLGASYQLFEGVTIGLQWLHGRAISGNISFQLNPFEPQYPTTLRPSLPPAQTRTTAQQQNALEVLLSTRAGASNVFQSARMSLREVPPNDFVDALFARNEIQDVQIASGMLRLITNRASPARCAELAALTSTYNIGVLGLQLSSDAAPQQTFRCAVPANRTIVARETPDVQDVAAATFSTDSAAAMSAIRQAAAAQRIKIDALAVNRGEVLLYYTNEYYFEETQAIDRLVRILMSNAPPDVEKFRLISTSASMQVREFNILRAQAERALNWDSTADLSSAAQSLPAPLHNPVYDDAVSYPRFAWNISPMLRQSLFDPDQPASFQMGVNLEGAAEIWKGLSLRGMLEANLFENFNRNRTSNSVLPHVRSDFLYYVVEGKHGIASLQADYHFRPWPTVFAVVKAGYLESMFAGLGGEILWRPEGARWALGADFYHVQQRNFDRLFGLQNYKVNTGHVSLYYDSPWYDLNFAVRAGQYLAGDRGLTIEVTRRFATGVEIGAFMTKTNVSGSQFGEGSFDKGIIIRIPLSWATPIETQSVFSLDLRPVQRDGGQRLSRDVTLYEDTRRTSTGELLR